jgi:hypothetical protein
VRALARSLQSELLLVPRYAPNLNLMERVGRLVKRRVRAARYRETDEAFAAAIDGCLDDVATRYQGHRETLLRHAFRIIDDVPFIAVWSIITSDTRTR